MQKQSKNWPGVQYPLNDAVINIDFSTILYVVSQVHTFKTRRGISKWSMRKTRTSWDELSIMSIANWAPIEEQR